MSLDERMRSALRDGAASLHADNADALAALHSFSKRRTRRTVAVGVLSAVLALSVGMGVLVIGSKDAPTYVTLQDGLPMARPQPADDEFARGTGGARTRYLVGTQRFAGRTIRFWAYLDPHANAESPRACLTSEVDDESPGGGSCDGHLGDGLLTSSGGSGNGIWSEEAAFAPLDVARITVELQDSRISVQTVGIPGYVARAFGYVAGPQDWGRPVEAFDAEGNLVWSYAEQQCSWNPRNGGELELRKLVDRLEISFTATIPGRNCIGMFTPRLRLDAEGQLLPAGHLGVGGVIRGHSGDVVRTTWVWRNWCRPDSPTVEVVFGADSQRAAAPGSGLVPDCVDAKKPTTVTWNLE